MGNLKGEYKHRKNLEWSTKGLHSRVKSLVSKNPCKLLDVGAGTGNLANLFYNEGYDVTVVDIENFLINKNLKFKKMDLNDSWPLKKETYNLVLATEIIEHLENPRHFIREIKRVLKRKGLAIITTPNIFNWRARIYYSLKGLIWGFRKKDYLKSGHITPITVYDFKRIAEEENLKIEKITYNNSDNSFLGANIIVLLRK